MKSTKRFLSALTSAVCTLSACASVLTINVSAASGDIKYKEYDNYVSVIGCDTTSTNASIAKTYLDKPVTVIEDDAFVGCTALTQVDIPETVTDIGNSAFNGCTELKAVSLPASVKNVGADAFKNTGIVNSQTGPVYYVSAWAVDCDSATAVEIKSGTTGIADSTFEGCGLQTVSIPATVKTIGDVAFAGNSEIREVSIPEGVETLGSYAFYDCSSLLKVTMPSTLTTIGTAAYLDCSALKNIKIPASVTDIGEDAFAYTADYSNQEGPVIYIDTWAVDCLDSSEQLAVKLNSGTKGIADHAFEGKSFVISAEIPEGVKTVGDYAFDGCKSLSQLSLPKTLTTIGAYAFCDTSIPSIVVPANVTSIGNSAFFRCTNLSDITINNAGCAIYDSPSTIYDGAKMHVAEKSTAYDYAIKYDRKFDYETASAATLGDIKADGIVNLYDIIELCKSLMNMITLTTEQQKVADYNGDTEINIYDAIAMANDVM